MAPLREAVASRAHCDLTAAVADVLCRGSDGAAHLAAMLADPRPRVEAAAHDVIWHVLDLSDHYSCGARPALVAAALPGLRALARTRSGQPLKATLWTIQRIGPEAAPLVPEVVASLDKQDVADAGAAALQAIGPAAAPAVPKLIALLRSGGLWRSRAVQALGGIGPAAAPALPDFRPVLAAAATGVCRTPSVYSEDDVIVGAVLDAASRIGGAGVEPLVPDLVRAFPRMRACGVARVDWWLERLGKLGAPGAAAAEMLLAMAEDPDEPLRVRSEALAALDAVGPRLTWWWRLRRLRKAFRVKSEIFARYDRDHELGDIQQPPPVLLIPPPKVPPELALCRAEAGLPPPPPMSDLPDAPPGAEDVATCLRERVCGPDEVVYRATLAACCRRYVTPARPPFCPPQDTSAR
jgi:hypothetical protein